MLLHKGYDHIQHETGGGNVTLLVLSFTWNLAAADEPTSSTALNFCLQTCCLLVTQSFPRL